MEKKQNDDVKADIQLLLECLEYQKGNMSAMKQAMVTLSSAICDSGSPDAQDIFRNTGGIQKVLNIVTTSKADEIVEVGLFCLGNAVEKNVYSQKFLSNASFFNFLHGILSPSITSALRKRQMAAFVLLCLVSNNSFGQNMARQSSCLHDILSLIRSTLSKNAGTSSSRNIELWATLVRAACVCVNNPVNDDNQRICSTLFPYLLNILGNEGDERILKPVLSLMCLTVSYNAQNQGKLTRCGGMQILIKKLKSLLNEQKEDLQQQTAIQLICTLDVCLTENENNSKIFGDLGGISLALNMLQHPGLSSHDQIQLVLILAHAVDSHASNKEFISRGNGIKLLIQQMTESHDEELTKTTKYLLHMCVTSENTVDGEEEDVPTVDAFAAKLEQMKKHSDLEILQKLNDLDTKLKDIESRDTDVNMYHFQSVNSFGKPEISMSDISDLHRQMSVNRPASVCSSNSVNCQHRCPTPREKTLMDELIKEKMEKEKLEKLNQVLQEDVVISRAALAKTKSLQYHPKQSHHLEKNDSYMSDNPSFTSQADTRSGMSSNINGIALIKHNQLTDNVNESNKKEHNSNPVLQNVQQMENFYPKHNTVFGKGTLPLSFDSDSCYNSGFKPSNNVLYAYPVYEKPTVKENEMRNYSNHAGNGTYREAINYTNAPVDLSMDTSHDQLLNPEEKEGRNHVQGSVKGSMNNNMQNNSTNDKLLISSRTQMVNYCEKGDTTKQNQTLNINLNNAPEVVNCNNSSMTRSRNAEIQCGTPYVNKETANESITNRQVNESSQTNFQNRSNNQKRKLIDTSTGPSSSTTGPSSSTTGPSSSTTGPSSSTIGPSSTYNKPSSTTGKDPVKVDKTFNAASQKKVLKVIICDVFASNGVKQSSEKGKSNFAAKEHISRDNSDKHTNQSKDTFLKPIAVPPRKKVRITPLMGSKKVLNSCQVDVQRTSTTNQIPDFSDLESEFDQQLVNAIKKVTNKKFTSAEVNPSLVYGRGNNVKSQNNTKKLDRHLDDSRHDATHAWKATPNTPDNQHIVPARPAFSDCGTRRFNVFESPFSVKSVDCLRKNSLNDARLNTPAEMNHGSPNSIDSDIEGCRSNSDDSEEDTKSLNITATALRSHQKRSHASKLCPGCHYCTDEEGIPLTSRTYNHTLETHPYTCKYHRQLRVYERRFIKARKKEIENRRRKSGRLLNFKDLSPEKIKSKSFDYQSSDSDSDHVTPPLNDDDTDIVKFKLNKTRKTRRQRLPYTDEEVNNLIEGVKKIGKHWNQILLTYNFHPSRTNVDLMDKFKRMAAADSALSEMHSTKPSRQSKPFSLCEERRLRKGVGMFGHNWKSILQAYKFEKGRTSEELRNRWRVLQKQLKLTGS